MSETWDILIVGGGPAGAATAGLLVANGMSVLICEGKVFPREKVCGEFMGTRLRPVLAQLGLLEEFDKRAGPAINRVLACADCEQLTGHMPADESGAFPRAMSRADFDDMLLRRARELGAQIRQPCHVRDITGDAHDGFTITTSAGIFRARTVILAHGLAQSGTLDRSLPPRAPARKKYVSFKTHFDSCDLDESTIAIAGGAGIYAGLVRSSADRTSLAFVIRRDRLARLGNSGDEQLRALLAENPAFGRLLRRARRVSPWLTSGPLSPGQRTLYHDGRFFVGNAAGEVHALVGEGITLALRGAALLADAIARHGMNEMDAAGRSYKGTWRKEFVPRCAAANLFANLMMRPSLMSMAASVVSEYPALLNACIRRSGK